MDQQIIDEVENIIVGYKKDVVTSSDVLKYTLNIEKLNTFYIKLQYLLLNGFNKIKENSDHYIVYKDKLNELKELKELTEPTWLNKLNELKDQNELNDQPALNDPISIVRVNKPSLILSKPNRRRSLAKLFNPLKVRHGGGTRKHHNHNNRSTRNRRKHSKCITSNRSNRSNRRKH